MPFRQGKRRWLYGAVAVVGLLVLASAAVPLLGKLTYDPNRCRAYSQSDIIGYVTENLEVGQRVCAVKAPPEWTNEFSPYDLSICEAGGNPVRRAEVYPDCGLEWRDPHVR